MKLIISLSSQPLEIFINDGAKITLHGLQQYYVELQENEKNRKLFDLLDNLEFNQCVVFVKSVSRAKILNKLLSDNTFPSIDIHSALPQEERYVALSLLRIATSSFSYAVYHHHHRHHSSVSSATASSRTLRPASWCRPTSLAAVLISSVSTSLSTTT